MIDDEKPGKSINEICLEFWDQLRIRNLKHYKGFLSSVKHAEGLTTADKANRWRGSHGSTGRQGADWLN